MFPEQSKIELFARRPPDDPLTDVELGGTWDYWGDEA